MSEQKRSRTGTRRTTMAVLEILKTSTSLGRPIAMTQIVKRLDSEYGIATSRDSVKAILDDLMEYYPGPDQIRCKESEKGRPYSFDYYYQTELPEHIQKNVQAIRQASVYKGYKRDKIEMRGDRAEMSDFPLYLNTVAGGLDCRNQAIGGFSFVVKIYALPVVEIIGKFLYLLGRYGFDAQIGYCF